MESSKKILIIDDELSVRFTLKKLLKRYIPNIKIYTSEDGVEGIGSAYIIKPDLIIIDSTLPKYSGRELVEFFITNQKFQNIPIILLNEDGLKEVRLPSNYTQIDKSSKEFPKSLISLILKNLTPNTTGDAAEPPRNLTYKFINFLSKKIIRYSNDSDSEYKDSNKVSFLFHQILLGFYLTLFYIILGRKDYEDNIDQSRKDQISYRSKIYPSVGITLAVIIFIFLQIFLILGSVLSIGFLGKSVVSAASYTWDGGGATENWSDCDNWSTNICPIAGDTVTFSNSSVKNSTVDAAWGGTLASIVVQSNYSGVITLERTLTTTSTLVFDGGTLETNGYILTIGSHTTMSGGTMNLSPGADLNGRLTLSGGTFNAPNGLLSIAHDFVVTNHPGSTTFNHNGGTITFDGIGQVTCNNVVFNLVNVTGNRNINSECELPVGNNPSMGVISIGGTLTGTGTMSFSNLGASSLTSTGVLTGFSGIAFESINVTGGTWDFSSYSSFTSQTMTISGGTITVPNGADFNFNLVMSNGTFNAPSGTMTLANGMTITGGTFNHNNGIFIFDGAGSTLNCGNIVFNIVSIANTAGTKTFNSSCHLPLGHNPILSTNSNITLNGTISGTGTFTKNLATLTLNAGSELSGFNDYVFSTNLTIAGGTIDLSSANSLTVNALTISSGSISLPATTTVNSTTTVSGGTFNAPNNLDLNGALNISGGTFNAPSGNMTLAGNLSITNHPATTTFNHNNGTITFDGVGTSNCSNVTFNNVVFNHFNQFRTISSSCTFPLGNNPTINGHFALSGVLTGSGTLTINSGGFTAGFHAESSISGFNGFTASTVSFSGIHDFSSYSPFSTSTLSQHAGTLTLPDGAIVSNTLTLNDGVFGSTNGSISLLSNLVINGGIFNAPSGNLNLSRNLTINGGTFNHNNGTVVMNGTIATWSCNNVNFNLVQLGGAGITKTINSNCSLPLGNNPIVTGGIGIVLNGTLSGTGTLDLLAGGSNITLNSGAQLSGFDGLTTTNLTISGATVDLSNYDPVTLRNNFTLNSGVFTAPELMTVGIAGSAGANFTNSGGTFNHNNGTILFGRDSAQRLFGSTTFFNISKLTSDGMTNPSLIFTEGTTQNILGTLTLKGIASKTLNIVSSTNGEEYFVDVNDADIQYLTVQDFNNTGTVIQAAGKNVTDNGNNTGWNFNGPGVSNFGPADFTTGKSTTNKQPTITFDLLDEDNDQVKYQIQIDNNSNFETPEINHTSELAIGGSRSFQVPSPLTEGSYYIRVKGIDSKGAESDWVSVNSGNIAFIVDTTGPTGNLILGYVTNSTNPQIYIIALANDTSGVSQMIFSENSNFAGASYVDFKSVSTYTLSSGYGYKRIYIKYKDTLGNESPVYSASILYSESVVSDEEKTTQDPDNEVEVPVNPKDPKGPTTPGLSIVSFKVLGPDGSPVVNAMITIEELDVTSTTDENGIVIFENIPLGKHSILGIVDGKEFRQEIELTSSDRVVTIQLEDSNTNTILIGVIVIFVLIILGLLIFIITSKRRKETRAASVKPSKNSKPF